MIVRQPSAGAPPAGAANEAHERPAAASLEVLRAVGLARAYGETRALRSCSLALRVGEVHAVVGENGCGKSTLVKILSGVVKPDAGVIELDGAPSRIGAPRAARRAGIATVFQEVLIVGPQSVLNNVWLGADGEFRRRIPDARKRAVATTVLQQLVPKPPPLDVAADSLDLATQQVCVIARALVQRPRVLILDESTSALDVSVRDRLFAALRQLCAQGMAVMFISHRMDEIEAVADRVSVLRSGESVATLDRAEATTSRLLQLMSGQEAAGGGFARRPRVTPGAPAVLRAVKLAIASSGPPIDVEFRAGEIVGVAGLEGHGQEQFIRILAGIDRGATGEIVRVAEGGGHRVRGQHDAARQGIAYVPRDRKTEGICEPLSILDNFSLPTLGEDTAVGLISERHRRRRFAQYARTLRIRLGSARDAITALSGGNQQKVIIARWLATRPQILVLNDPTRGVDLGTKRDIYRLLTELAASGVAVVMLSTEIEEHIALMDRVLVFRERHLFAELEHAAISRKGLIAAFFGRGQGEGAGEEPE